MATCSNATHPYYSFQQGDILNTKNCDSGGGSKHKQHIHVFSEHGIENDHNIFSPTPSIDGSHETSYTNG